MKAVPYHFMFLLVSLWAQAREVHVPPDFQIVERASTSKPNILFLSSSGRELTALRNQSIEVLETCGYQVRDFDVTRLGNVGPERLEQMTRQIAELGIPNDTPLLVSAVHGNLVSSAGKIKGADQYLLGTDKKVDSKPIFQAAGALFPGAPKLNDSCNAGFCAQYQIPAMGYSSMAGTRTMLELKGLEVWGIPFPGSLTMATTLDLLCDSINQCNYFKGQNDKPKVDTNNDGFLDGTEINAHLKAKHQGTDERGAFEETHYFPLDQEEAFKNKIQNCLDRGLVPKWMVEGWAHYKGAARAYPSTEDPVLKEVLEDSDYMTDERWESRQKFSQSRGEVFEGSGSSIFRALASGEGPYSSYPKSPSEYYDWERVRADVQQDLTFILFRARKIKRQEKAPDIAVVDKENHTVSISWKGLTLRRTLNYEKTKPEQLSVRCKGGPTAVTIGDEPYSSFFEPEFKIKNQCAGAKLPMGTP